VKELVELIAQALVDQPDKVVVSQIEGEQTTILELKVAPANREEQRRTCGPS